jgi:organic radical activating enzyme
VIYRSPFKVVGAAGTLSEIKNYPEVIIFGTGNYGALALHALSNIGIKVSCFGDNNENNWGTTWKEHKIISHDEMKLVSPDTAFIIASARFNYMNKQLKEMGFSQIYNCDFLFSEFELTGVEAFAPIDKLVEYLDLYMYAILADKEKHLLKVKSLDVVVTEKCSLKCVDCANLMQYYQKPINSDSDELFAALDRFMENVDEVYEARVLGGEPFMNKNLPSIVEKLTSYNNCHKIVIYTNGTIVPKEDKVSCFLNKRVSFAISNYNGISKNVSKLEEFLDRFRVPFVTQNVESWQDCASSFEYRGRSDEKLNQIFGNCCANDLLTILHGKLYLCPFPANAETLRAIPHAIEDSIDLIGKKDGNLKEKIRTLYSDKNFIEACKYCNGRDYNISRVKAGVQTRTPLSCEIVS